MILSLPPLFDNVSFDEQRYTAEAEVVTEHVPQVFYVAFFHMGRNCCTEDQWLRLYLSHMKQVAPSWRLQMRRERPERFFVDDFLVFMNGVEDVFEECFYTVPIFRGYRYNRYEVERY